MGEQFISREEPEDQEVSEQQVFGDYIIEKEIAKGGQGTVYQARKKEGNQESVALKISHKKIEKTKEQFARETAALMRLRDSHPNIVNIREMGIVSSTPFIALELVNGKNLEDILQNYKRIQFGSTQQFMPAKKIIDIMLQTTDALEHAHKQSILHGDLKPANILITEKDEVKITDFGLSQTETELRNSFSMSADAAGSLGYMSPQLQRGEKATPQDDIYALGVIFYYMLTNQLPRDNNFRLAPSKINQGLPKSIDSLYEQMIAANPQERCESAAAVKKALADIKRKLEISPVKEELVHTIDEAVCNLNEIGVGQDGIHQRIMQLFKELEYLPAGKFTTRLGTLIYFDENSIQIYKNARGYSLKINISQYSELEWEKRRRRNTFLNSILGPRLVSMPRGIKRYSYNGYRHGEINFELEDADEKQFFEKLTRLYFKCKPEITEYFQELLTVCNEIRNYLNGLAREVTQLASDGKSQQKQQSL